ncbi:MAG: sigma-54-dependent Fis family transcriptional regulator [Thiotrichales bacterium]|jgi:DNA-binding NtrC family response regulator|nr:sigma-54-dependent Fis family transcriptional regulator [Thiotrichales bacterium]
MSKAHILVIDDEPDITTLIQDILEDEGYQVDVANTGNLGRDLTQRTRYDLLLLDVWLPDIDGISLLKEFLVLPNAPAMVMMSGHATIETAVEATKLGAVDFLEKPLSLARLLATVEHALAERDLARTLTHSDVPSQEGPVGRSPAIKALREQIKKLAPLDAPVLIEGEAGSGKKLAAYALHRTSPERGKPFAMVTAAQLNDPITFSEWVGADSDGKLAQADGGTIVIEDIDTLTPQTQQWLDHWLSTGQLKRLDGHSIKLNARIIGLTLTSLVPLVAQHRFRDELYYRLSVLNLTMPPLRERKEDIPELLNYYIDHFVRQHNLKYRRFGIAAQNILRQHNWPGNVRELKNLVHRLLLLGGDETISEAEVQQALIPQAHTANSNEPCPLNLHLPLKEAREAFERNYLVQLLTNTEGSVTETARMAGLERTHLYRKLKSLSIDLHAGANAS